MPMKELFPILQNLDRAAKWQIMLFLIQELAKDENPRIDLKASYPIWSPYDAFDAGAKMMSLLAKEAQHA